MTPRARAGGDVTEKTGRGLHVRNRNQEPWRILLVRNDRIGDLVLTLPAFEAVRRLWPRAHIAALVSPTAAGLLAGTRSLDDVVVDDAAEGAGQLARRLKQMRFDSALIFNTNTRNCLAVWLARIPRRVAWGCKPIGFLTANHRVAVRRSHPPIHEADFALAFVSRLVPQAGAALQAQLPRLEIDTTTRNRVAERIARDLGDAGPLFGVHPGNLHSAYNWPASNYAELASRLAHFGRVMVTSGASEQSLLDSIRDRLPESLRLRVGFYTDLQLLELAAALEMQTALTVSSTGPMHIAGILGTPIVALFSPHPAHAPAKWSPLGTNHTLLVAPLREGEDPRVPREQGTAVMARITVDQVLEANLTYAAGASANAATRGNMTPDLAEPLIQGASRR